MLVHRLRLIRTGALGSALKRKARHMRALGTPCSNCGAELQGPFCHICGQSSDDQHRSILHLVWEGIEGLTHLDGRLGQTLPLLLLNPGALARDHFEGRRQRHVPPFRMFLITLLVFMFTLESVFHGASEHVDRIRVVTPGQSASVSDVDKKAMASAAKGHEMQIYLATIGGKKGDATGLVQSRLNKALANRAYYLTVLFTWAHRLAILLLPILAGLLALAYVGRRAFYVYDHLIVSMQFLSFLFLVFALAWVAPEPARPFTLAAAGLLVPVNLYQTLRGAYGSTWYAAALKTALLWGSTVILFGALMSVLITLELAEVAG